MDQELVPRAGITKLYKSLATQRSTNCHSDMSTKAYTRHSALRAVSMAAATLVVGLLGACASYPGGYSTDYEEPGYGYGYGPPPPYYEPPTYFGFGEYGGGPGYWDHRRWRDRDDDHWRDRDGHGPDSRGGRGPTAAAPPAAAPGGRMPSHPAPIAPAPPPRGAPPAPAGGRAQPFDSERGSNH